MRLAVYLLLFIRLGVDCGGLGYQKGQTIEADIHKQVKLSEFFDGYKCVCLETTDSNLIGDFTKIELDKEKIYVLDRKQEVVCVYDRKGHYLGKLNKRGRAPDEYLYIQDFGVWQSDIYCLSSAKLYRYTAHGKFVEAYPLKYQYDAFQMLNDSLIYLYAAKSTDGGYNYVLYNYQNGQIMKQWDPFGKNRHCGGNGSSPFFRVGKQVFVAEPYIPEINQLTSEGKKVFCKFRFNTRGQLPAGYEQMSNDELNQALRYKESLLQIKDIHLAGEQLTMISLFFYDGLANRDQVAQVDLGKGTFKSIRLNDEIDPQYPFMSHTLRFDGDDLVTFVPALAVIRTKEELGLEIPGTEMLREDDNPVLVFHHLKQKQ